MSAAFMSAAPAAVRQRLLSIDLLGSPRIIWQEQPLVLPRRQLRALLYRLAAAAEPLAREQLCFLLWPDSPEAAARRNLVVLLNHLRRALPREDVVLTTTDAVGLDRSIAGCDALELAEALTEATAAGSLERLATAVERWRGPFLDGFTLPDAGEFEAWLLRERESWQRRYLDALTTLIQGFTTQGAYPAAIAAAHRYLEADETAESVHRQLIALYALTGDRATALRQYERCSVVLDRELGVEPDSETRAVYKAIRDARTLSPAKPPRLPAGAAAEDTAPPAEGTASARAAEPAVPPVPPAARPQPAALPAPATPLLGRDTALSLARTALLEQGVRLLTVSGPGGTGKTRLAIEVARRLRPEFPDGVVFVPLAAVQDSCQVAAAIARACGLVEAGQTPPQELLTTHLQERRILLVLDNCEHVLAATPLIATLLAAADGLSVLATSRVRLNLSGEHTLPLPPLPLPDPQALPPLDELAEQPAVALLVARARAADPQFQLSEANAAHLAAICVRLDGLPLALELAAGRLKLLSPARLLGRLERRLAAIDRGPRDLPERQQTLRATIAWSERLLSAGAQALFARLAVFVDGFCLEAAEAVCGGACTGGQPVEDVLETLCDTHLVNCHRDSDGEPRFVMLETVREYALEQLAAEDAVAETGRRHAAYFAELAEQAAEEARGPMAGWVLRRIDTDHANVQAAITWAIEHNDTATAMRLTASLERFWLTRGLLSHGRRMVEQALAPADDEAGAGAGEWTALRARSHQVAGALASSQGDFPASRRHMEEAARLWRGLGRSRELAGALLALSYAASLTGDRSQSQESWQEGEDLAHELASPAAVAALAQRRGREARQNADPATAHFWLDAALTHARRAGDPLLLIHRLLDIVPVTLASGNHAAAHAQAEEALQLSRELGHRVAEAQVLNELGETARCRDAYDVAAASYCESLRLWREAGNRSDVPRLLHNLGYVALRRGDLDSAESRFHEALTAFRAVSIERGEAEALAGLACVAAVRGHQNEAARLWHSAEAIRDRGGWAYWPPDRIEHGRYLRTTAMNALVA